MFSISSIMSQVSKFAQQKIAEAGNPNAKIKDNGPKQIANTTNDNMKTYSFGGGGEPNYVFDSAGNKTGVDYIDPQTGYKTGSATFDSITGKMTSKSSFDANGKLTSTNLLDSETGKTIEQIFYGASEKQTSAEKYTLDGKLLATATFNETGSFDEVIYDTDTGEVLTKCSGGGEPFSNCDPASIAKIKQIEAELKQQRADMDAAIQAQKDANIKEDYKSFTDNE